MIGSQGGVERQPIELLPLEVERQADLAGDRRPAGHTLPAHRTVRSGGVLEIAIGRFILHGEVGNQRRVGSGVALRIGSCIEIGVRSKAESATAEQGYYREAPGARTAHAVTLPH